VAWTIDPEIAPVLVARANAAQAAGIVAPSRGDALALRAMIDPTLMLSNGALPDAPDVESTAHYATTADGSQLELRWYTCGKVAGPAAILYVHGGGMIAGMLDNYDRLVRFYVQLTGVPFLAVGYRLAPEFPDTVPANDAFVGVQWLFDHASDLGVDVARIGIMGDSGGGGVGAGAAILARNHGVALAKQILIYPMLDDRNTVPDPELAAVATWNYDANYTGWHALLGDQLGQPDVSPIVAPARLTNFTGLAPGYIEVGELDLFRDESIRYAQQLLLAGISCELHVHPGAPHGHDVINLDAAVRRRALADRTRVITSL
jgi:acetyl esterase/lipase